MPRFTDTIAALATPNGTSAIALVRVSGPDVSRIAREVIGELPSARLARHGDYRDRSNTLVDDVLFTFFPSGNSYTGEDALEISSHGNPFITQKILEDLFARGCRAAEPGEFTQRAFLNGRMDLSQAEAVMDLIHARSERALAAANQQLRGSLGRTMAGLTERLLAALARIEAYIDFPDEDLPAEDRASVRLMLESLSVETGRLLATSHYGELLRDGIKTVIVGAPNAGKSSLLNRLVGRERAIVSPEPGTTRDFIEERIIVGPHCLRLIDTAGINLAPGAIEKLGIEKSMERVAEADLILFVMEAGRPLPALPASLVETLRGPQVLTVMNKIDLAMDAETALAAASLNTIRVSALTGEGIEALTAAIVMAAYKLEPSEQEAFIAINARHADALARAQVCLGEAIDKLGDEVLIELIASDLRGTLGAYGDIVGRIDNERMLDHLFSAFCIGK
ncbi:MAG: tRNA uridine-5-carboxymethylaminomethyl(34) synthesis GTPase MnmE [Verrucomicrobia bacterium]|nr:tRNA uridine-5-carboxymethylaminomethyl(34) synthesis GTPase MnmE [Verrucomicrobiota bacterium]